jgi:hypothetical protein
MQKVRYACEPSLDKVREGRRGCLTDGGASRARRRVTRRWRRHGRARPRAVCAATYAWRAHIACRAATRMCGRPFRSSPSQPRCVEGALGPQLGRARRVRTVHARPCDGVCLAVLTRVAGAQSFDIQLLRDLLADLFGLDLTIPTVASALGARAAAAATGRTRGLRKAHGARARS